MEFAEKAYSAGNLDVAVRHSLPARQLIPLSGSDAELESEIESELAKLASNHAADAAFIQKGQELKNEKRLYTAIENLGPVEHLPVARQLIDQIEVDLKTHQRYCENCEEDLNNQCLDGAEHWLKKAQAKCQSRKSDELEKKLRKILATEKRDSNRNDRQVFTRQDKGVVIEFEKPELNSLVVFGDSFVLGAERKDNCPSDIRIAASGSLHQQHAVILRHRKRDSMQYWIMPHPSYDENCVRVTSHEDGQSVELSAGHKSSCLQPLKDGDVLELYTESSEESSVQIVFYHANDSSSACLKLPKNKTVHNCQNIILLEDYFEISNSQNSHIKHSIFGEAVLKYRFSQQRNLLLAFAETGILTTSSLLDHDEFELPVRTNVAHSFELSFQKTISNIKYHTTFERF